MVDAHESSRVDRRTTVCTPTFMLSRKTQVSTIIGWFVFALFIVIVAFIFVAMISVMNAVLPSFLRVLCLSVLAIVLFVAVCFVLFIDILSSLDESLNSLNEYTKRMESNIYNLYITQGKKK